MNLQLTDEQAALLDRELTAIIDGESLFPLAENSDVARDSQFDPPRTETRTAARAEAVRAAARRTIPQTTLGALP